jgi:hypothetical protein
VPEVAEAALDDIPEDREVAPDMVVVGATEEALETIEVIDEAMEVTEATDVPEAGGAVEAAEGL